MIDMNINDIQFELSKVVSYDVYSVSPGHLFATYFAWRVLQMKGVDKEVRDAFEDMYTWLDSGNETTAEQQATMANYDVRGAEYEGDEIGYIDD